MVNATAKLVDRLTKHLDPAAVSVEIEDLDRASRDYSWLSPILTKNLPATTADVVAMVGSTDDLRRCLDASHTYNVAVTPRGAGTGNYGQSVPLRSGLVIDVRKMSSILEIGDGWIEAEAGARFTALEAAANSAGQELALYPSTVQSTLGGFIAGGAGGTGTIENGFNHQGFVLGMDVCPCVESSEVLTISADALASHIHTYGVTGIMTKARVRLVPKRDWTTVWASFEVLESAAAVGRAVMALSPLPRMVGVSEAGLVRTFPNHLGIPRDKVSLRAVVDASVRPECERLVHSAGGVVESLAPEQQMVASLLSFNHITLWAKTADPGVYHLQARGRPDEDAATIRSSMAGVMIHFDGVRYGDEPGFAAMLIAPFNGESAVRESIGALRDHGVTVINPHTWQLGDHIASVDAAQRLLSTAKQHDPRGLLNPGRLEPVQKIASDGG